MMLSDDKVTHMSHVILKALMDKDVIDIIEEEGTVRHAIRRVITQQLKAGSDMEDAVRQKIESLSRGVAEGSPEWDTLHDKYMREEEGRRGLK